jgi:hypothetical protein
MCRKSTQFSLMLGLFFLCLLSLSPSCLASIRESVGLEYQPPRSGGGVRNSPQLQEAIRNNQKQAGNSGNKRNRLSADEREILRKQIRDAENEIYYFNK